jgi:hypothetical protein
MSYKSHIPNALTSIRFLAGPIFFYAFLNDSFAVSLFILVFVGSYGCVGWLCGPKNGYILR